ncbi:MAG: hypothetical protein C4520_10390 [Candidatus Abyssobacteria bacterium SURF_5]|uniref:Porin n=1 Tax=Abyssobacteria bacterium (strain SURF_5) TaxID=2093360 RepID=A0A3A4NKR4_ABYX5|nr:MAG: hypothetical protein C4520_10390 [Candidatus Abyssubacteria bacterium SURF_5]
MRSILVWLWLTTVTASLMTCSAAHAEEQRSDARDEKIEALEQSLRDLNEQLQQLKTQQREEQLLNEESREKIAEVSVRLDEVDDSPLWDSSSWLNRFTMGGYGEFHANFEEGPSGDQFDIHRLVLYLGYDFNDWIKFHSETEIEHAFVTDGAGGELVIEQAYFDFLLSDLFNVRAGRILTPLGIINQKHEPVTFYGVERPSFAQFIIPSTWSSDGIGLFGNISPSLKYQAYVVNGLNGSKFNALSGIRAGRIKERPGLHDAAFTGRLDYFPFALREVPFGQWLRLGVSTYAGGIDNGNQGKDPGINGDIQIYSADFEYTVSRLDFRGAVAFESIDGAEQIGNGTAEEIFGWYLEGAYRFWPDKWKTGKLRNSDAAFFVRYDDFDTQYSMPSGVPKNPNGDRNEITVGMNFYLTPNVVLKADYQFRDSEGDDPGDAVNFGIGWVF